MQNLPIVLFLFLLFFLFIVLQVKYMYMYTIFYHCNINAFFSFDLFVSEWASDCCLTRAMAMVFNATFNNISVISWQSILLVEEIGLPGINLRPAASNWQTCFEWASDCCLTPIQQLHSYISARTSQFSMRWWWDPLCTRPTRWAGFL